MNHPLSKSDKCLQWALHSDQDPFIMVNPITSRQVWEDNSFIPYWVDHKKGTQCSPLIHKNCLLMGTIDGDLGYFARSTTIAEWEENLCIPIKFNSNQLCWTENCWILNRPGDGHWQAYRTAQRELGLNITKANYNAVAEPREAPQIPDTTPSRPTSPNSCASTPLSTIRVLRSPSPWPITPAVTNQMQLAEILNTQDPTQMSITVTADTITAQISRIDPNMGHMFTAVTAQYWARGADRPDPPHNLWIGWVRSHHQPRWWFTTLRTPPT